MMDLIVIINSISIISSFGGALELIWVEEVKKDLYQGVCSPALFLPWTGTKKASDERFDS